jgi:hypothetical protein
MRRRIHLRSLRQGRGGDHLYLRYVIGMVDPETLHTMRERHIRCNPALGQFIVDEAVEPIRCDGPFDKHELDPEFVKQREDLVTRGWRRLRQVVRTKLPIVEYPLADATQEH